MDSNHAVAKGHKRVRKAASFMACRSILVTVVMASLFLALAACKPASPGTALAFATIEQKDWSGVSPFYESRAPGVIIVSQPEEVTLEGIVTKAARAKLQTLDYSNYFALLVLQGWEPSTGYSVTIDHLRRLENRVEIYAVFSEPEPDREVGHMVTSRYYLVQVAKTGTWTSDITFDLFVSGTSTFSSAHFIP